MLDLISPLSISSVKTLKSMIEKHEKDMVYGYDEANPLTREQIEDQGKILNDLWSIYRFVSGESQSLMTEDSPILGFDCVFKEHVIVDYDIPNKIISAKFKPGSPFKRVNVFLFYRHIIEHFKIVDDLIGISFFAGVDLVELDDIHLNRVFTLTHGWDFSEDTKKILSGHWGYRAPFT